MGSARLLVGLVVAMVLAGCHAQEATDSGGGPSLIPLPAARQTGLVSVEEALVQRRSIRSYQARSLRLEDLAQLLWAAQGITAAWGGRTAPSAGATYPLEIYAVVGQVEGLSPAVYRYIPQGHALKLHRTGDLRAPLSQAAWQPWIRTAPVTLVIAADYLRTTLRYGERGIRYVHMEVGHVGQNVYLQATALGLGTVIVGAFWDLEVQDLLGIPEDPLALMPVGYPYE